MNRYFKESMHQFPPQQIFFNNKKMITTNETTTNYSADQRKIDEEINELLLSFIEKKKKRKESLYMCEFKECKKIYKQKYRLKIHQRTHVSIFYFDFLIFSINFNFFEIY